MNHDVHCGSPTEEGRHLAESHHACYNVGGCSSLFANSMVNACHCWDDYDFRTRMPFTAASPHVSIWKYDQNIVMLALHELPDFSAHLGSCRSPAPLACWERNGHQDHCDLSHWGHIKLRCCGAQAANLTLITHSIEQPWCQCFGKVLTEKVCRKPTLQMRRGGALMTLQVLGVAATAFHLLSVGSCSIIDQCP